MSIKREQKEKGATMAPLTRESSGVHYNVQTAVHLPGGEPAFMT